MIFLLVRGLPLFIGLIAFAVCQWQWRDASIYPWPLVAVVIGYGAAAGLIAHRRLSLEELVSKMAPGVVVLFSMGFAFLMVETPESRLAVSILFSGSAAVSLEMLWMLVFDPARYPVHGLSRLNIAFMPLAAFFTCLGLTGLGYFIRTPEWITPAAMSALGALAFFLTSHHSHNDAHRNRWTILGAAIGLQAGILAIILPVSIVVQGAFAAFLFAIPLRIRRYSTGTTRRYVAAWGEGIGVTVLFLTVLLVSRWA
ncbi:hypothetical protein K8R04_04795 [Candidatus Uhrbacteria bacterium]|nr:hypothetical protein [Candidatus Uhrbacteria bacterium]